MEEGQLETQSGKRIATFVGEWCNDTFCGDVVIDEVADGLMRVFVELEEIVNDKIFSLLDDVQAQIGRLRIRVRFKDQLPTEVDDLQVYPSSRSISFRRWASDREVGS